MSEERGHISLELSGKLADVLVTKGYISAQSESRSPARYQLIRYFCGSAVWARMVKLELYVGGTCRNSITPRGENDEIYLVGDVPQGQPLQLRITRAPGVDPSLLPSPFPDIDVRLEVHG